MVTRSVFVSVDLLLLDVYSLSRFQGRPDGNLHLFVSNSSSVWRKTEDLKLLCRPRVVLCVLGGRRAIQHCCFIYCDKI